MVEPAFAPKAALIEALAKDADGNTVTVAFDVQVEFLLAATPGPTSFAT